MSQTLWLETYVPNTYASDPLAKDLFLRHLWLETYVSDTYGWRPMSQTLWLETYFSDTYASHTLIDLLISYALYVVPSYGI